MFLSSGPVFLRRGSNVVDLGLDLHVYNKRIKHSFPYINVCQARV